MGTDIHTYLAKYNKTENKWETIFLFRKENEKIEYVHFYEGRNYALFDWLKSPEFGCKVPFRKDIAPEAVKLEYEEADYCFGFYEVNLADLHNFVLLHPTYEDYDDRGDGPMILPHPLAKFYENATSYIYFAESFSLAPESDYKIIYWFDN